jgi:hypothetical protein
MGFFVRSQELLAIVNEAAADVKAEAKKPQNQHNHEYGRSLGVAVGLLI